ncbi:MAG: YHS domain-containing (seleno)protein [Phycisphaeraceae bacterium]
MNTTNPATMTRRQAIRGFAATLGALAVLPALPTFASDGKLDESVRLEHFNLGRRSKLALDGYDPVSYFDQGPKKGKKDLAVRFKGVVYRFANDANKQAFLKSPSKYEPAYGGWCAWAMLEGGKTDVDPENYIVLNDRVYVFYKGVWGNTKRDWQKRAGREGDDALVQIADKAWAGIVG